MNLTLTRGQTAIVKLILLARISFLHFLGSRAEEFLRGSRFRNNSLQIISLSIPSTHSRHVLLTKRPPLVFCSDKNKLKHGKCSCNIKEAMVSLRIEKWNATVLVDQTKKK
jgi:hypothetical protein